LTRLPGGARRRDATPPCRPAAVAPPLPRRPEPTRARAVGLVLARHRREADAARIPVHSSGGLTAAKSHDCNIVR